MGVYTSTTTAGEPLALSWQPVYTGFTFEISTDNGAHWQTATSGTVLNIVPANQGNDLIVRVTTASGMWVQGWSVLY